MAHKPTYSTVPAWPKAVSPKKTMTVSQARSHDGRVDTASTCLRLCHIFQ